jgi:WD40 repeat protein
MLKHTLILIRVIGLIFVCNVCGRVVGQEEGTSLHEVDLCRLPQGIDVSFGGNLEDTVPNAFESTDQLYFAAVDIHPNGDILAVIGKAGVYFFDAYTREYLSTFLCIEYPADNPVIKWSPNGSMLATFFSPLIGIRVYDVSTNREIATFNSGRLATESEVNLDVAGLPYSALGWSPDSKKLAALGIFSSLPAGDSPTGLWIWNIETNEVVLEAPLYRGQTSNYPTSPSLAWSPYGGIFACACTPGGSEPPPLYLFDGVTFANIGELPIELPDNSMRAYTIDWSSTNLLAIGGNDIKLQIWNMDAQQKLNIPDMFAYAFDWHPNGNILAVSTRAEMGNAPYIAIFNVETMEIVHDLRRHERPTTTVLWHPDGNILYSVERRYLAEPRTSRMLQWVFSNGDVEVNQF